MPHLCTTCAYVCVAFLKTENGGNRRRWALTPDVISKEHPHGFHSLLHFFQVLIGWYIFSPCPTPVIAFAAWKRLRHTTYMNGGTWRKPLGAAVFVYMICPAEAASRWRGHVEAELEFMLSHANPVIGQDLQSLSSAVTTASSSLFPLICYGFFFTHFPTFPQTMFPHSLTVMVARLMVDKKYFFKERKKKNLACPSCGIYGCCCTTSFRQLESRSNVQLPLCWK